MTTSTRLRRPCFSIALSGLILWLTASAATAQVGHYGFSHGHHRHGGYGYGHYGHGHRGYGHRSYYPSYGSYRHHYSYQPYRYRSSYRPSYRYGGGYSSNYRPRSYSSNTYSGGAAALVPNTKQPYTTRRPVDVDPNSMGSHGWTLLAGGNSGAALSAFGEQATANPNKGEPKIGYALSAAVGGDLSTAAWAMRRACRADPNAMRYVHLNEQLQSRVGQLVERYQGILDRSPNNRESAFMLASLHYLLGDTHSAHTEINLAVQYGDRDHSTTNLRRLIDERVAEQAALQQQTAPTAPSERFDEPLPELPVPDTIAPPAPQQLPALPVDQHDS